MPLRIFIILIFTLHLSAHASGTTLNDEEFEEFANEIKVYDPFESVNRKTFGALVGFDKMIVKPLSRVYVKLPNFTRIGVAHVVDTTSLPLDAINNAMVFDVSAATRSVTRMFTNAVFGLFGTIDVAGEFDVRSRKRSLANAWRFHGLPLGPYIVTPFFFGTASEALNYVENFTIPQRLYGDLLTQKNLNTIRWSTTAASIVDARARNAKAIDSSYETSADVYVATRAVYYSRLNLENNGREAISPNNYQYISQSSPAFE